MKNIPQPFVREQALHFLEMFRGKDLIKVITGQRRAGKSTLLKQWYSYCIKEHQLSPETILIIDLENALYRDIRTAEELYKAGENYAMICVDEIQEIIGWEKTVRYWLKSGKDVTITGSNASLLSGELATLLAGRYVKYEIFPFSYAEYCDFFHTKRSRETFEAYLQDGGMPYALTLQSDVRASYYRDVIDTIILRDVMSRSGLRDPGFVLTLIQFLATSLGGQISALSISKYLKSTNINKSSEVIANYLGVLSDAYIIQPCRRWDIRGKKLFQTREKYYFSDLGIRHALVGGMRPDDISGILENAVYLMLRTRGYTVYTGELGGLEVDFIAKKDDKTIYVQVCYLLTDKSVIERESKPLLQIPDNFPKYIVSMDSLRKSTLTNGIHVVPMWEFMAE